MTHCTQCGQPAEMRILDRLDMGFLCIPCFNEITSIRLSTKPQTPRMPEDQRQAIRVKALEKARAVRSERAKEKRQHKEAVLSMKIQEDPQGYAITYAKRLAALAKARLARNINRQGATSV